MTLSATGFTRQRLTEIKTNLDFRLTEALGPVMTGPDSVVGQIGGIVSDILDEVWQQAQDTYDSMYPASAEGVSLDGAVSFVGLERLNAAATSVTAMLYGSESTPVAAGALASAAGAIYALNSNVTISRSNTGDAKISVASLEDSAVYQIIAGGQSVFYISDTAATKSEILNSLAAQFDTEVFNATVSGETLRLRHVNNETGFALAVSTRLQIDSIGTPGQFTAVALGAAELPAGALNTITTVTLGWNSILNLTPGTIGRDTETDEQLRYRHAESIQVTGTATVKAIRARLLDIDTVTYAQVYENRTNSVDRNGLPSHSFESVVLGGSASEIAETIWTNKPAGIEPYGTTTVTVTDDNGDGQVIRFSRPEMLYAWIQVRVNELSEEEVLSPGYIDSIKAATVATGNALGVGKDIITQRFYGPIFEVTQGLSDITIEVAVTNTPGATPVYTEDNIIIGRSQLTSFDTSRVSVVPL